MDHTLPRDEQFRRPAAQGAEASTWLTVEGLLYGALVVASWALRLAALGRWPLLEEEASTALAAWRAVFGGAWQPLHVSPLMMSVDMLLFALFRGSDGAVRLLPALVGGLMPLMMLPLRRRLGRYGALVGALLLTLSPTWVSFSRTAATPILSAACALLLGVAALRYLEDGDNRYATLGVIALGLGLASGPGFYTLLFAAGLYLLLRALAAREDRAAFRDALVAHWRALATRDHLILLLGVWLAVATALTFNLRGIGASADLAGWWASELLAPEDLAPTALLRVLTTYEFLTLALAAIGLVWGWRRRDTLTAFLSYWALLAIVIGTLGGHREPMWTVDVLLPLVLLAARGGQVVWDLSGGVTMIDLAAAWVALVVLAFCFLEVVTYTHIGSDEALTFARVVLGLLIVAWAAYWYWREADAALRVAALVLTAVTLTLTVRGMTAVAYTSARDPREPLLHHPVAAQMRTFEQWMTIYSSRHARDSHMVDVAYVSELEPWLGWYLRDFANAEAVPGARMAPGRTVLVTLPLTPEERPAGYMAQRFWLRTEPPAQALSLREKLRWFLYRDPVGQESATEFQVWALFTTSE